MVIDTLFKTYQEDAIRAAEELMYGDKIIARLEKATTEGEILPNYGNGSEPKNRTSRKVRR